MKANSPKGVEIAATFEEAGRAIVRRMLDRGGELLTVVTGEGADEQWLASITAEVAEENPDVEVESVRGGQPLWPLIIGLE